MTIDRSEFRCIACDVEFDWLAGRDELRCPVCNTLLTGQQIKQIQELARGKEENPLCFADLDNQIRRAALDGRKIKEFLVSQEGYLAILKEISPLREEGTGGFFTTLIYRGIPVKPHKLMQGKAINCVYEPRKAEMTETRTTNGAPPPPPCVGCSKPPPPGDWLGHDGLCEACAVKKLERLQRDADWEKTRKTSDSDGRITRVMIVLGIITSLAAASWPALEGWVW